MPTKNYDVLVDVPINNKIHRTGSTVKLTDRQAKYLYLAKKIVPVKSEPIASKRMDTKSAKVKKELDNNA